MTTPKSSDFAFNLARVTDHLTVRDGQLDELPILPTPEAVDHAITSLPRTLPATGLGTAGTLEYLMNDVLPGCLQAQAGPRYFGFVTGGVTPAAQLADILGSSYDENVQVTLPDQTAATAIEARVLELVLDLLDIPRERFQGRTITTGATSCNVLGLACARDYLYAHSSHLSSDYSFARSGPPISATQPNPPIIVLALHPHFSICKAAALVGIGSGPGVVHAMPCRDDDELAFDLDALESRLKQEKEVGRGVVVAYGLGEVNTGGFGRGLKEVAGLCKTYGAWLHVDAAFGGFAGIVPELQHLVDGMDLAHSLTLDGHKWLNVPYDCGLFYTKSATSLPGLFAPPEAPAYLAPSTATPGVVSEDQQDGRVDHAAVPSPLYVNIENSRRFRALPLLASLMSLGKEGYTDIVRRNVSFARQIGQFIHDSEDYELLNYAAVAPEGLDKETPAGGKQPIVPLNIVLFAPSPSSRFNTHANPSAVLTHAINSTRKLYVTGTRWRGRGAIRMAVSNWRTGRNGEEDAEIVIKTLEEVMRKS